MISDVIIIRTKASPTIGFGHLRRCITLAKVLRRQAVEVHFVVNDDVVAVQLLQANQFAWHCANTEDDKTLSQTRQHIQSLNASMLIVDSYDIDSCAMSGEVNVPILVIDDRMDIAVCADILLNPMMTVDQASCIDQSTTACLRGFDYILLDEQFNTSLLPRQINQQVDRILLTVGGSDVFALTPKLIAWVFDVLPSVNIDVVIGPFFAKEVIDQIDSLASGNSHIVLHKDLSTLHSLMNACDLAVCGGGQTTFELAATGTPAIAIKIVENQAYNLAHLAEKGVLVYAGDVSKADLQAELIAQLKLLASDYDKRLQMSQQGSFVIDAKGATRVTNHILDRIRSDDAATIQNW